MLRRTKGDRVAELEPAFQMLMELEGGGRLHTVPGDPGGTTKYGISQRAHPDVDIAGLTLEKALDIYRREYWEPLKLGAIQSQKIANEVFEFAVNAGFRPAARALQKALNAVALAVAEQHPYWPRPLLAVDGRLGPNTRGVSNSLVSLEGELAEQAIVDRFNLLQLAHYRGLRRDLVDRFLLGWTRRVV